MGRGSIDFIGKAFMASNCEMAPAAVWLEIESTVKRLSRTWLAKTGYYMNVDDHSDVIGEARVRFLASFTPEKSRDLRSALTYARRCCLSSARSMSPRKDLATHAVHGSVEMTNVACQIGKDEGFDTVPTLGDLPSKLSKRISWFAAHPKQVSERVLSRLRQEIW